MFASSSLHLSRTGLASVVAAVFIAGAFVSAAAQSVGSEEGPRTGVAGETTNVDLGGLEADIAALDEQIAAASSEAEAWDGGLIKALVDARVETLRLTRAILANRLAAERGGAVVEIIVPAVEPDPARATEILAELQAQETRVAEAEQEAAGARGLMGAMAQTQVQAEKMALAELRTAWYRAQYGIVPPAAVQAPAATMPAEAPADVPGQEEPGVATSEATPPAPPSWADPAHPEIDYDHALFRALAEEGFMLHGWWAVLLDRAEIDDSPRALAVNQSGYEFDAGFAPTQRRLVAQCSEGTASVVYIVDEYVLTSARSSGIPISLRIDDETPVQERWSELTSNQGAGIFGAKAEALIRRLMRGDRVFLRLEERNGKTHDQLFDLAGSEAALQKVADACGFPTIELDRDDYRALQGMLNAGGYDAGPEDGIWGAGSKAALKAFQEDQGLPATGAPDRATLEAMGLEF